MSEFTRKEADELLMPVNMIRLYSIGAFPMCSQEDPDFIEWYMPGIRAVIPLDNYNVPRSLRKFMEKSDFTYKFDHNFKKVVEKCAEREETWISPKLIKAYERLEKLGHIHTVEVYQKGKLVGGLYGVTFGGAFFGESMFSKVSQASKAALVVLLERLNEKGFVMLDVQYMTEHLRMFGAVEIPFEKYNVMLKRAAEKDCMF